MKKIIGIVLFSLAFSSCQDVLEITPRDRVAESVVWTDESFIKAYHNELYNAIPTQFDIHMYSKFVDEAYNAVPAGQGPELFKTNILNPDNVSRINNGTNNYMGYWNRGYQYIRKINIFVENMSLPGSLEFADKTRLIAEAKFLRAYVYYELIKRYGGVPIVTKIYKLGETEDFTRNTFDECVAYIEQNLDEANTVLPEKIASTNASFGRATKDASHALRSIVLLYAASPLFNPTNDITRWQKAATAAEVFVNNSDRGFVLYPDYGTLFNQESAAHQNEYIFARNYNASNGHQAPMHNVGRRYGGYGGWWASNGPAQNLVDDYDMTNGMAPFTWTGNVKTMNAGTGYDPNNPYLNRDPRFYATVINDNTVYHGDLHEMWVAENNAPQWGFDSYKQSSDNPRSGYILRKFMQTTGIMSFNINYTQPWPFIRLAEIYLNYAEAKLELGDEATCRTYINKVRARTGVNLPPVTETGAALRTRLINERRIELAFEGHRYFDVRRWKIADQIDARPIQGMDIFRNMTTGVKRYVPFNLLVKGPFLPSMYLLPVETNEIRRTSDKLQTPGW